MGLKLCWQNPDQLAFFELAFSASYSPIVTLPVPHRQLNLPIDWTVFQTHYVMQTVYLAANFPHYKFIAAFEEI